MELPENMSLTPLISVVIPTFNREHTISRCLDSVAAQTYTHFEAIVVDDCSTDGTPFVAREYGDDRVHCIILSENRGAQAARNRGILEARGDWIAFHDSDDEWLPSKLEKQVAVLQRTDFDPRTFIYGNAYRFDHASGERTLRLSRAVEGENCYTDLLRAPAPIFPTMLTSKKMLETIGYLDEKVPSFQEWDTAIRLSKHCQLYHLVEPLMVYHVNCGEAISGNPVKHVEGWHYIINKHRHDIVRLCGNSEWLDLYAQLLWRCLEFGLTVHYDRYRAQIETSNQANRRRSYLALCRKYGIRPNNLFYRGFHRLFRMAADSPNCQGRIVKEE